ncbi:MAG: DUF423 domain-containing protein [Taibaiella sp.]|nr:DUF423 domain-containing protein [Taibaiella sp.]
MYKPALVAGALLGGLAVILGAFGAHSLKQILTPDQVQVFETGVRYNFYHCFALLAAGILYSSFPFANIRWGTLFFIIGIILFSGSLYLFPVLEAKGFGIPVIGRLITPLGGLFFILGWLELFLSIIKKK